jgi:hypothetical protein
VHAGGAGGDQSRRQPQLDLTGISPQTHHHHHHHNHNHNHHTNALSARGMEEGGACSAHATHRLHSLTPLLYGWYVMVRCWGAPLEPTLVSATNTVPRVNCTPHHTGTKGAARETLSARQKKRETTAEREGGGASVRAKLVGFEFKAVARDNKLTA